MEKDIIELAPYNVFFIADLHLRHKNILRHQPQRVKSMGLDGEDDIDGHDRYIIEMFLAQTKRNDHIYILGDAIMSDQQTAIYILNRIKSNGCKLHLIIGNHDKSIQKMFNMFESIELIKNVVFKKSVFPFLDEDLQVVMCHYPMKSWPNKCRGSLMLHGHTHDNSPWEHEDSNDLQINVGLDCPISNYQLISLEKLYGVYKEKLNGLTPKQYSDEMCKINPKYIR